MDQMKWFLMLLSKNRHPSALTSHKILNKICYKIWILVIFFPIFFRDFQGLRKVNPDFGRPSINSGFGRPSPISDFGRPSSVGHFRLRSTVARRHFRLRSTVAHFRLRSTVVRRPFPISVDGRSSAISDFGRPSFVGHFRLRSTVGWTTTAIFVLKFFRSSIFDRIIFIFFKLTNCLIFLLKIPDYTRKNHTILQKSQYQITISSRGAPQIIICNGFRYGLSRNNPLYPTRYWRCTSSKTFTGKKNKCCAAGKLTDDGLFILSGDHCHPVRSLT